MLDVKHYVGLDLGQVNDDTALVVLRREQEVPELPKPKAASAWHELELPKPPGNPPPARYYCPVAERFERGTSYTTIVENVCKLFAQDKFAGQVLVVDGTGVGRPVVDLFRKAKITCRLMPVTITGGAANSTIGKVTVDEWGYWHVPKKELVGSVQVLLGTGRLEVAPRLKQAQVLVHELKSFSYKISQTAHVSLEAWREQDHDDLVLGLALAAWAGERVRQELWVK